jgi:EF hand
MRLLTITCACAALTASAGYAQQALTTAHLAALDANGDGGVDSGEFGDYMAQAFHSVDANADGFLTAAESQNILPSEMFDATNLNNDDGISQDEFMAQVRKDFSAADLDGNGVLD